MVTCMIQKNQKSIIVVLMSLIISCCLSSFLFAHNWQKDQVVLFSNIEILEDKITMGLSIPGPLVNDLLKTPISFNQPFSIENQQRIKAEMLEYLQKENPIIADGARLSPKINELMLILTASTETVENPELKTEGVSMHSGIDGACMVLLEYPLQKTAKQIQIQWTSKTLWMSMGQKAGRQANEESRLSSKIMPAVLVDGEALQPFRLTIQEPEFVWHRTLQTNKQDSNKTQAIQTSQAVPIPFTIPIVSILILVIFSMALIFKPITRKWYLILITALLVQGFWRYQPIALKGYETQPSSSLLIEVFKSLHQGIYVAFQAKTESEIYDRLAQNVSGALLDQIYQSTYQGLILKEEGNAKSSIREVKYLDVQIEQKSAKKRKHSTAIHVSWQIFGEVNHWGHQHFRVNQYEAIYEIEHQADGWKIVEVQLIEQKRKPELEKRGFENVP
jgi:hypothetical protein